MSKPYDATLKQLMDAFAADWVAVLAPLIGLSSTVEVEPLDADLSTIQPAVDKVFRLRPPANGLLHLESQSSWDGGFSDRMLLYNVLLEHRYGGPVYSIVLLLRRDASTPNLTGLVSRVYADGSEYHRFHFSVVRVWELEANALMTAGLGAAPLALLTDDAVARLPELVTQFAERLEREAPDRDTENLLLTCGFILLGLRYDKDVIRSLFMGVQKMRESSTYQLILEEGIEVGFQRGHNEGRNEGQKMGVVQGEQQALLAFLDERFGNVPAEVKSRILATTDPSRLQNAVRQVLRIQSPGDLQL